MNKILFWILIMAIAGIIITMALISLAPYIAGALVIWLVFFKRAKKIEPKMINIGSNELVSRSKIREA